MNSAALRAAFDALRPHVRPDGDAHAGALDVAIQQAEAADAAVVPADPLADQLAAIRDGIDRLTAAAGV